MPKLIKQIYEYNFSGTAIWTPVISCIQQIHLYKSAYSWRELNKMKNL